MQNGHFGNMIIKAVDKKEIKPFLRECFFFKTIIGLDLQHGVLWDSILPLVPLNKLKTSIHLTIDLDKNTIIWFVFYIDFTNN